MADLLLETGGYCFLCLAKPSPDFMNGEHYGTTYSLQYLSRYLKLDMKKVFGGEGEPYEVKLIPPELLVKVERSKLKAELCQECASLTGKLSQLYKKLEKIELEMKFYTNLIHGRLVKVLQDNSGKDAAESLRTLVAVANADIPDSTTEVEFAEKLKIVDLLRADAIGKCASKLTSGVPRVKVEHMKRSVIRKHLARKVKIESSLQNNPKYENISASGSEHEELEDALVFHDNAMKYEQFSEYKSDPNSFHVDNSDNVSSDDSDPDFLPNEDCIPEGLDADIDEEPIKSKSSGIPVPDFKINITTGYYKCQCSKEFTTRSNYTSHFRSVHMGVSFGCPICQKTFAFRSNLNQHRKLVHAKKKAKFKCNYCSKTFSTTSNRNAHERGYCPANVTYG